MAYRYGSARTSTLSEKIESIPFGIKPGDSPAWRTRFDDLILGLRLVASPSQLARIHSLWNEKQTYQEIVAILEPEYQRLHTRTEAKEAREQAQEISDLRSY